MGRTKFTAEEKREMVLEYFAVARGQRGRWLAQRDVNRPGVSGDSTS